MLINYKASNFEAECTIDSDWKESLDKMNDVAKKYWITVIVIDSIRKDLNVGNAIVKPATHGEHLIAEAIDANFKCNGVYFNSTDIQKSYNEGGLLKPFIDEVVATGIRWGGHFHPDRNGKVDPVHFDSGLYLKNPALWQQKYNEIHGVI